MTLEKFKLLCWKNFTLQKRHPIAGLFEIIFPILIVVIFSFARSQISPQQINELIFNKFEPLDYNTCRLTIPEGGMLKLGVSPGGQFIEDLIKSSVGRNFEVEFFESAADLNQFLNSENQTVVGIEFEQSLANTTIQPKKLNYAIRLPQNPTINTWLTEQLFPVTLEKATRDQNDKPHSPPYYYYCFLTIQNDIERAFIKAANQGRESPKFALQRFPYPKVFEDMFISFAGPLFPVLFVICMLVSSKNIIKNVTIERETQLKETMKMMGLSSGLHWSAWFTKCFILLEVSIIGMVILTCTTVIADQPMFAHSNFVLIWTFLNIYATSVITFSFLISVVFKKSSTAANVGSILFFVTLIPYNQFKMQFYSFSYILKMLYCLLINSGMGQGTLMILIAEGEEVGLGFANLFKRETDAGISIGEVMLLMILGMVLQMLLTLYIEKVFPGDIGIPEPWYFPFIPCFNFLRRKMGYNSLVNRDAMLQDRRCSGSDQFEEEPSNLKAGIRINNLSKSFGSKSAVNNLDLNIYEDQITVLLGHNGAGKTTTMSMLTGMFPPTSGTAYLNGKDIRTEINEARVSLGLCPQHNILFDELTVKEHIIFFARLKGIKGKREIADEVRRYVNLLDLKDKVNAQSRTLSGGMKRKLSIGIALCGDSKIVMCDEPSSGMDPSARRALWDLLIAEKKGRTILLTTHHMDEADMLGDRIAIMAEGRLRTVGSSFFLKKKFGTGYKLICVKEAGCDANSILDVVRAFAPDAKIESDAQTEVVFVISEQHLPIFQDIFKRLEDNADKLRISSFGCSLTTLEEVFLKLGTDSYHGAEDEPDGTATGSTTILFNDTQKVSGSRLLLYQTQAMFTKKFHYLRRNYRSILYMALFSVWIIVALMSAPTIHFDSAPARDITFGSYDKTTTVVQHDESFESLARMYRSLFDGKDSMMTVKNVQDYVLEESYKSLVTVNRQYLVGASFDTSGIVAWFNGQPFHTMPLALNTMNRAILKSIAGPDYDIAVVNKPYVFLEGADKGSRFHGDFLGIIMPLVVFYFLLTYWPSVFIGFYIKERESRAKLLQFISGANRFVYWLTAFLFDFAIYFVVICAILGGVGIYQREYLSTFGELGTMLLIFTCYGIATLPLIYAFSYLFTKHSTGESMVAVGGLLMAVLFCVYAIMKYMTEKAIWKTLATILYWFGLMLGPFSLLDSFVVYGTATATPETNIFTFEESGIGRNLVMMVVGGVFFMAICLIKDHMLFDWFIYKFLAFSRKLPALSAEMDADVKQESDRIRSMTQTDITNGNLVLNGLTKYYGNHLAVNQLHLAVGGSECFGLLGINGAGKTTTFKMMTGDEIISSGDAFVRGYSMKNQMNKVHQLIGYCPQFDALLLDLTGRETLKIFSLLRGIPRHDIKGTTTKLAHELGFEQHLDKKIKAFSGGNKRKLSTALALIGDPSLIFLDEPTTGMDPGAKRQLWDIINRTRNSGRSVVMTSHSMEECEALCTKIAIMVNGEFKCLGSTQHLKNKFSKGLILTVKVGRDDEESIESVNQRVQQLFPSAVIKEKYLDIVTFHITATDNLKWSHVFASMAQMKNEFGLADYALTQTSLEQVFLFFTKSGLHQRAASQ